MSLTQYKNKVRLRACGILIEENRILLVRHIGLGSDGFLWSPPGGGLEFGESSFESVEREFLEETGLQVSTENFILFHEHLSTDLHAVELFFKVKNNGGLLRLGTDPEKALDQQILVELKFWSLSEIQCQPATQFHARIFDFFQSQ